MSVVPTEDLDLRNLPPAVDLPTVARFLGISKWQIYKLAREGQLPLPVVKLGASYRVPSAALRRLLEDGGAS